MKIFVVLLISAGFLTLTEACSKKKPTQPQPVTTTYRPQPGVKPGTCDRPYNNGRRRRDAEQEGILFHLLQKRQIDDASGRNGQGGNPWRPPPSTPPPFGSHCYQDYDCPNNQKCCDRQCRTPSFVG